MVITLSVWNPSPTRLRPLPSLFQLIDRSRGKPPQDKAQHLCYEMLGFPLLGVANRFLRLEGYLGADLPISGQLLADGFSKCARVCQVAVQKEIGMIEEVEELKPELEVDPLREAGVLI
jgi:hypothetical protein